jgi:fructokinase
VILAIGEILVDRFPQYNRTGGAPFNFVYHAKHLGTDIGFITRIGDDPPGSDILAMLKQRGFDYDLVQVDRQHPTGQVIVTPDKTGGHEFEILPDAAYDHIIFPDKPSDLTPDKAVALIYFGTLAQRTQAAFDRVQTFLRNRDAGTKCFYDINLRPGNYSDTIIRKSLEHSDILKLNIDELDYIRKMFDIDYPDLESARWLIRKFDIEIVSLTRGADGSDIITADYHGHAGVPSVQIADTVGAGDGYAAILAVGCLKKLPFDHILSMATEFSAKICQIKGAVPDNTQFYERFRKKLSGAADV